MIVTKIVRFSSLIIFLSSDLFASSFIMPPPYEHCFAHKHYKNADLSDEAALTVGECFYLSAENISLDDKFNNDFGNSSSRAYIISALQYADSWYRLAIKKGNEKAITRHQQAERALIKTKQKIFTNK